MGLFGGSGRETDLASTPSVAVAERVDSTYALAAGLYVAALATPGVLVLVGRAGIDSAAALYVALLVVVTATTIGTVFVVRRLAGLPEQLGRSPRQWAFAVVAGLAAGAYLVVGGLSAFLFETAVMAAFAVVVFGGLLGILLAAMSRTRYVNAVLADEPVACEWEAGWPRRWQIGAGTAGLALMAVGFATVFLDLAPGGTAVAVLGGIAYALGPVVMTLGQPWTYRVRPSGLERTRSAFRRLDRWDRISGVDETETTLVIRRRGWWRPPIHCAWSDLDDTGTVRESIERYASGADRNH